MLSGADGQPRSERDPRRHDDGPGPGPAHRRARRAVPSLVLGIEPNELRLEDGAVDDLRLVPSRGRRRPSRRPRRSTRRACSIAWSATARAGSSTAASSTRCLSDAHEPARQGQPRTTSASSTSTSSRSATSRSASSAPRKEERLEGWRPTLDQAQHAAAGERAAAGRAASHMKLMLDLIVLAFQMDKTRIATLHAQQRPVADELQLPRRACRARCTST